MEFHLQNVRTGETVKLSPERTLIGTADHAAIRTGDGPYLAALAVRYPGGWAVFGLSDDPGVTFNRRPFGVAERVTPKRGDLFTVGDERFTFLAPGNDPAPPVSDAPTPACFAYIQNPDGKEECRAVDHDLLFGRLQFCHVQIADTRLSRVSALLAAHDGAWYIHTLSNKPLGRNRKAVHTFQKVADGDELLIGPLVVRVEIRSAASEPPATPPAAFSDSTVNMRRPAALPPAPPAGATDFSEATDDGSGPHQPAGPDLTALRAAAQQLEHWLKGQNPSESAPKGGLGGWLGAQRDKLKRFWLDTPETTAARSLRSAGRVDEAFAILDRAIRARPDGPELLRELYRLYEAVGFTDLCYRPLRQIEKLAQARGTPDPWILETLARLCERMGRERLSMIDRAIHYWRKLETATGVSTSRQRTDALALRALHEGGYAGASGDNP
jgi:tetratricopeptide (TPR) repeat protein